MEATPSMEPWEKIQTTIVITMNTPMDETSSMYDWLRSRIYFSAENSLPSVRIANNTQIYQ